MSEPERWTDEWIAEGWLRALEVDRCDMSLDRAIYSAEQADHLERHLRTFARAVAKEAMEEAADMVEHPQTSYRRIELADKIRARAKEVSGER